MVRVVNKGKDLLYCFLKSIYGVADSQIFVAENLNVDIP